MNFNPVATIARKRDGGELSPAEIHDFVAQFTHGSLPDYQMAALAMAIYLRGMTAKETAALTDQMLQSGSILDWPAGAPVVDKHSTGGIGDKVSLVLAPLLACCDLWVPMISGRGLGPTGGTLDKLEAISGYRTNLSLPEIRRQTEQIGCTITGATAEIAPADRKLYALRDVTATVASIPLITASIMSKKLAAGLRALVLDVKWGSGAFMKTVERARELAQSMVATGTRMQVTTVALLTDMNQPLGRMAGNAVEIQETLDTLAGTGPADLVEVTLALGAELLLATGRSASREAGLILLQQHLASGRARERFERMVAAQQGSLQQPLMIAPANEVLAPRAGWLAAIDTERLGWIVIELGGGRRQLADPLDHSVGLETLVRLGERVERGQPLLRILAPASAAERVRPQLIAAFQIEEQPVPAPPLIVERLAADSLPASPLPHPLP